jgi:Predicted ATPase with chaperone activity
MLDTYKNKISGPILDRIDLWLEVPHVPYDTLTESREVSDETKVAREQITKARELALARLKHRPVDSSAEMSAREIEDCIRFTAKAQGLLRTSSANLYLSPRSYHRHGKVDRTLADFDDHPDIETPHELEALEYRVKL